MKRFIAVASFIVIAVPALADGLPYDQSLVDRALPDFSVERAQIADAASVGSTRSDLEISVSEDGAKLSRGSGWATGAWANDSHFIAPAQ